MGQQSERQSCLPVSAESEPLHPKVSERVSPDVLPPASVGDTEPSPGAYLYTTLMRVKDGAPRRGHEEEERAPG